jgi:hypothetical protein
VRANKVWTAVIIVLCVALGIAGVRNTDGNASSSGSSLPPGAVGGSFNTGSSIVSASQVWCRWSADDSHVVMHIRFENTGVEDVRISYYTRYTVTNGGTHGDSQTNLEVTDVPAGQTIIANDNAGTPSGVTPGSPLGSCEPYTG